MTGFTSKRYRGMGLLPFIFFIFKCHKTCQIKKIEYVWLATDQTTDSVFFADWALSYNCLRATLHFAKGKLRL